MEIELTKFNQYTYSYISWGISFQYVRTLLEIAKLLSYINIYLS